MQHGLRNLFYFNQTASAIPGVIQDSAKADVAEALLQHQPVISVQVLNEVTHVCVRKLAMTWDEIKQFLDLVRRFCIVVPLTESIHDEARQYARVHRISFYDACIVAAAVLSDCRRLYTEDMNHGQRIDKLELVNPFQETGC